MRGVSRVDAWLGHICWLALPLPRRRVSPGNRELNADENALNTPIQIGWKPLGQCEHEERLRSFGMQLANNVFFEKNKVTLTEWPIWMIRWALLSSVAMYAVKR